MRAHFGNGPYMGKTAHINPSHSLICVVVVVVVVIVAATATVRHENVLAHRQCSYVRSGELMGSPNCLGMHYSRSIY